MNLFTYGTLMDPAVWSRVAREPCPAVPAVLHGYEARRLRDADFPGLLPVAGGLTKGLLYRGVSAAAMTRLDVYEDDFYQRVPLTVHPEGGGSESAEVYLIAPNHLDLVLPECWAPPSM